MITPPYLKPGDTVGIISPARCILPKEITIASKILKLWKLNVKIGKNALNQDNQFAGTDDERAADLQEMLNDKMVKAILCTRGGYGTIRLIEKINSYALVKMPKWIVGYSDITVLHAVLNHHINIKSIHGIMPLYFSSADNKALESLKSILFGNKPEYIVPAHPLNITGRTEGTLIGGNLSVMYSMAGTKYDIDTKGKILFLEDLDEYLYHIDRMMMNFKLAGKLEKLRGIIVGGMTNMHDNEIPFGKNAFEIIKDVAKEYNFPIVFNFPAGHVADNLAMILGNDVTLLVDKEKSILRFS